jgi:hypothetical protein
MSADTTYHPGFRFQSVYFCSQLRDRFSRLHTRRRKQVRATRIRTVTTAKPKTTPVH